MYSKRIPTACLQSSVRNWNDSENPGLLIQREETFQRSLSLSWRCKAAIGFVTFFRNHWESNVKLVNTEMFDFFSRYSPVKTFLFSLFKTYDLRDSGAAWWYTHAFGCIIGKLWGFLCKNILLWMCEQTLFLESEENYSEVWGLPTRHVIEIWWLLPDDPKRSINALIVPTNAKRYLDRTVLIRTPLAYSFPAFSCVRSNTKALTPIRKNWIIVQRI